MLPRPAQPQLRWPSPWPQAFNLGAGPLTSFANHTGYVNKEEASCNLEMMFLAAPASLSILVLRDVAFFFF